jgi:hypothetical protein
MNASAMRESTSAKTSAVPAQYDSSTLRSRSAST